LVDLLPSTQAEQFAQFVLGPFCHAYQETAVARCTALPMLHQTVEMLPASQVEIADAEIGMLRNSQRLLESFEQAVLNVVKYARHVALLLFLIFTGLPHAVLDIVVDNEIQFFVGEAIMFGKDTVYLPNSCET